MVVGCLVPCGSRDSWAADKMVRGRAGRYAPCRQGERSRFAGINASGYIQRIRLETLEGYIRQMDEQKLRTITIKDWVSCKVPAGARTIELSPDGRYIFAACNFSSCLAIVDAEEMKMIGKISADSYPVGLDVSKDGRYVLTTSQGREGYGGNSVNIFEVKYL